ncbi:MAG: polyprenyl diphosphate synthase [Syntrophorhabdales bacterium]|jgi:short-chain Z-isoprenyl diphosphate synthase
MNYNLSDLIHRIAYYLYDRRLSHTIRKRSVPTHLGLILDGNRRYAKERCLGDVAEGHREGARRLDDMLQWCADLGIRIVTVWGLSPENTRREKDEVEGLFTVIREKIEDLSHNHVVVKNRFKVRAFGKLDTLPADLQEAIRRCEESTGKFERHMLNIAIGYGGREEIVEAAKKALTQKKASSVEELIQGLNVDDIANHLYTGGIPDPDLIIRTSGEIRLSGFLLWQSAYSEFYFCDALWPLFRKTDFLRAIRNYQHRNRRFGK